MVQAEHVCADSEAEDHDEQPVGRSDGDPVEEHGHERQEQRPEGAEQHEVGEHEHYEDDPGESRVHKSEKVDTLGRHAADIEVHPRRETGVGKQAGTDLAHELLGGLGAEVIPPEDDRAAVLAGRVDVRWPVADRDDEDLGVVEEADGLAEELL